MTGKNQDEKLRETAMAKPPMTRRGMIRSQAKVVLAIGATMLTASVAKAAPRPPCFLRGTKLRTETGDRNVEDIKAGDLLVTASGPCRAVEWVGRWKAQKNKGAVWSRDMRPVLIRQSALGPNTPNTDLFVSQGHAIFVDGVLVPAGQLVNGTSITLDDAAQFDELEYFHVKLATHDVIFAAGAPTETLWKRPDMAGDLKDEFAGEPRCAPILYNGIRSSIAIRVRSLATPLLGPQKIDVIRSRLHRQAIEIGC